MNSNSGGPVVSQLVVPGRYKHFKGDEMEVLGTCFHSETLEEFVVYRHLTGERAGENYYWVRPVKMFCESVVVDGKEVPRFKYLD